MPRTGYSKDEAGENDIPTSVLIRLADHYGTSIDYLLGHTDTKELYPSKKNRRVCGQRLHLPSCSPLAYIIDYSPPFINSLYYK